jgi:hypothetical protein
MSKEIAAALREVLVSPNESDRNLEAANIVDGLFAIARALERVAQSIDDCGLDRMAAGPRPLPAGAWS